MLRGFGALREVADAIANECDHVIEAYRNERVTDEPHITDRLMGAIESHVKGMTRGPVWPPRHGIGGVEIKWEAMTLRAGSRSAAHEKRFGADILGVFQANLDSYKVKKGFLAQAKRTEPSTLFARDEWHRLQGQCERMLKVTPASFVIVYSKKEGVRFFSALAVLSLTDREIFQLYSMPPRAFFERHFESFIGDRRLDRAHISVLERLHDDEAADERPSLHVLKITAEQG